MSVFRRNKNPRPKHVESKPRKGSDYSVHKCCENPYCNQLIEFRRVGDPTHPKWGEAIDERRFCTSDCANAYQRHRSWSDSQTSLERFANQGNYTNEFNRALKQKIHRLFGYACQMCGEVSTRLHTHHVDYNKENNSVTNLIPLCPSCHGKTNFNREYWKTFFDNAKG